jgi:ribonuclease P/MRP protein subunit POP5
MRPKHRYLLIEVIPNGRDLGFTNALPVTEKALALYIRADMLRLHGDYGLASLGNSLQVKYMNPVTRMGIVRVSRDGHRKVLDVLKQTSVISEFHCRVNILHVSGKRPDIKQNN